jgi:hypothetical protein
VNYNVSPYPTTCDKRGPLLPQYRPTAWVKGFLCTPTVQPYSKRMDMFAAFTGSPTSGQASGGRYNASRGSSYDASRGSSSYNASRGSSSYDAWRGNGHVASRGSSYDAWRGNGYVASRGNGYDGTYSTPRSNSYNAARSTNYSTIRGSTSNGSRSSTSNALRGYSASKETYDNEDDDYRTWRVPQSSIITRPRASETYDTKYDTKYPYFEGGAVRGMPKRKGRKVSKTRTAASRSRR